MTEDQAAKPTIRAALPGDFPAICELFPHESNPSTDREKHEKDLRMLLEQSPGSSAVFVAVQEGQVLGLCTVRTAASGTEDGPAGIVENLVVHRDSRGQSIGGSLLGSAMIWCTKQGITRMQLLADRDDASALQFCFSRGWNNTGSICLKNGF